jgi:hypothetical protein
MRTNSPGWSKYYKKNPLPIAEKNRFHSQEVLTVGGWRNINKNPQTQTPHKAFIMLSNIGCFLII